MQRDLLVDARAHHDCVRRHVLHRTAFGREPRRHDVGARENKPDRAPVDPVLWEQVGKLVEQTQRRDEWTVAHLKEEGHEVVP